MATNGHRRTTRLKDKSGGKLTTFAVRSVASQGNRTRLIFSAVSAFATQASGRRIISHEGRFARTTLILSSMFMIRKSGVLSAFAVRVLFWDGLATMDSAGNMPGRL